MEIILLERIEKLGQMGDVVTVKDGFARNYLLPQRKALRATKDNMARFETDRGALEARNLERKTEAEAVGEKMEGAKIVLVRQASDMGQLYGSATARDIAEGLIENGYQVDRQQVVLERPIKTLGIHGVRVVLHPEIFITVDVNVARSEAEAERQEAGAVLIGHELMMEADSDDETVAGAVGDAEAAEALYEDDGENVEAAAEADTETGGEDGVSEPEAAAEETPPTP